MKVVNMAFYRTLDESEKVCATEHPENLAKFQEIKSKILYNGYEGSYEFYRAGTKNS